MIHVNLVGHLCFGSRKGLVMVAALLRVGALLHNHLFSRFGLLGKKRTYIRQVIQILGRLH